MYRLSDPIPFIFEDDDNTGRTGLIPLGADRNEYFAVTLLSYSSLPHDLLEHHDITKIGCHYDEIEALGAWFYLRGSLHDVDLGSIQTPEYSLVSSVTEELTIVAGENEDDDVPPAPLPPAHQLLKLNDELDYLSSDFLEQFRKYKLPIHYRKLGIHHLMTGYLRAQKRFPDQHRGNKLFHVIADATKEFLETYDANSYRGYHTKLYINQSKLTARFTRPQ